MVIRRRSIKMRIVSWNCQYGFTDGKVKAIEVFDADILVIPECREIDMKDSGYDEAHSDWFGDHKEATISPDNINHEKDRGIGVFCNDNITIKRHEDWEYPEKVNCDYRYLVPYTVTEKTEKFKPITLIVVWTKDRIKNDKEDKLAYVQKAYAAFDHFKNIGLLTDRVIMIGDFNTFAKNGDERLKEMEEKLSPLINCAKDTRFWKESTYYHVKYGYGIDDFCFASTNLGESADFSIPDALSPTKSVKLWNGSDHCPIIVDFKL
jgi:exonuclease III